MLTRPTLAFLFSTLLIGIPVSMLSAVEPQKVVEVEGIAEYQFDNGLKLLLFPDNSRPTVTVNLTIFVGSRHEGYGESGMAHLLEHMVFKGTPLHPNVPKVLQERGAQFNGTTWYDRTNYFETLPASDDNLEFAIRLEADRMVNSFIRAEDLASEMTVVRNEFERGENSPRSILRQRMMAVAFEWHNYGKSTIGNRSDIERVPITKLRDFYRRHYQPDNAMVVVAGQFDRARALEYVAKYFGTLPRPERELDRTYTEEPAQDGERSVTLRRVGDSQLVGVAYHIPAGPHPESAAVDILSYILATEPAGRLYKTLVETKKATAIVGSSYSLHDPGVMMMMASARREDSIDQLRDTMIEEIERIATEGVTEDEVTRVRQQILSRRERAISNTSRLAVQLSEWAAQGDWRLFFLYRDRIEKVTAADVQAVAQKYLKQNNRTVGLFIPTDEAERVDVPSTPDVEKMVADYKGRAQVAVGEEFDPSPDNIEARTKRYELSPGMKVALLQKKTRGQSVQLRLTLRYGSADSLAGRNAACEMLPMLMGRGTKELPYQEFSDELDKNRAVLRPSGSAGRVRFTVETKREYLPAVMSLLAQVVREPALPAAEFEVLKRERISQLEQSQNEPRYLARRKLLRTASPFSADDVRYTPTITEEIDRYTQLTVEDTTELYQQFIGGAHGEMVVVGDFDEAQVRSAIAEMLEGWQVDEAYTRIEQVSFTELPGSTEQLQTPDKENAVYYAALNVPMKDTDPDFAALVIGDFILGGGTLSSRLGDRVRQEEGLSYGIGSQFTAASRDSYGRIGITAISNPDNIPKVAAAVREEIDLLLEKGITEDELGVAKQGYLQRQQVTRSRDSFLAAAISDTIYAERTMDYYRMLEDQIAKLSTEEVVGALRRHIDPDRFIIVTAGDFEK